MTRDALLLARQTEHPCMVRTTTRVNHLRGPVRYGPLPDAPAAIVPHPHNPGRFVPVPAVSRARHFALEDSLRRIREMAETSPWNTESGSGRLGVAASGISRAYLADALAEHGWGDRLKLLELGFSWPLPEKRLRGFMAGCDRLLVLEEGEPLLERDMRALAQREGLPVVIAGKGDALTVFGEYSTSLVVNALAGFLGEPLPESARAAPAPPLPGRPPNLCPGCSHRAVYYAARKVFGDEAYYSSDIGCYTLGMAPPLRMADFLFCMGSSISAGSGFALAADKPVVAFIGDSTFFHSGITGLANAVFNRHNLLAAILDNGTTAMTGHQPNPGVRQDVIGEHCARLDIEAVVRGCGVAEVTRVRPYNLKGVLRAFEEMKGKSGVRVIIAEEACVLFARRALQKARTQIACVTEQNESVRACLAELACPAFRLEDGNVLVDETLCAGCMVCLQIAPSIKARKVGERSCS
jgi:indolepyruvate ferredoxin oxidoreductase alpha subunit